MLKHELFVGKYGILLSPFLLASYTVQLKEGVLLFTFTIPVQKLWGFFPPREVILSTKAL